MANNFASVEHIAGRNVDGINYMKAILGNILGTNSSSEKEDEMGSISMNAVKVICRKAFGAIPLFRTTQLENGVMTFQAFFNDFAEANNINANLRVTGVWNEATQKAFDMIVAKYEA